MPNRKWTVLVADDEPAARRGVRQLLAPFTDFTVVGECRDGRETLAALDRPGAGFAISAQDMDQRGAGDLLGEDQSGHVRLVGAELAHHLFDRALRQARGETPPPDWIPDVNLGCHATIPAAYIPEPEVRLNLYHRIARAGSAGDVVALAEEIAD